MGNGTVTEPEIYQFVEFVIEDGLNDTDIYWESFQESRKKKMSRKFTVTNSYLLKMLLHLPLEITGKSNENSISNGQRPLLYSEISGSSGSMK